MANITDNEVRGIELNQLSRLLFGKAANRWYIAVLIELIAGIISMVSGLIDIGSPANIRIAISLAILAGLAFYLRQKFEVQYGLAETMRRQSLLTEGLSMPLSQVQYSIWRQRAGKSTLSKLELKPREEDYYQTQQRIGPRKLLEMTQESAFWTRCLYGKLYLISRVLTVLSVAIVLILLTVIAGQSLPGSTKDAIALFTFLLIPVILTQNSLGWSLKLSRLMKEIQDVESDIEKTLSLKAVKETSALRLVFEYNCILANGFPIPDILFGLWHDNIQSEWNKTRNPKSL